MVHFRASEALDIDGYRAEVDHVLDAYRAKLYMDSAGEIPVALNPDEFSEANKGYTNGVLSSLKDDNGRVLTRRLCPNCHNDITMGAGYEPSTIVSVVGIGQSMYLNSLVNTLKSVTSHNFGVFCAPASSTGPLVLTLSFADSAKPEISIAFLDMPGDDMADSGYMDIFAAHIRNSAGVIFLVDPLQFRSTQHRLQQLNRLEYDISALSEPTEMLGKLIEKFVPRQANGTSSIPVATVLTKSELLESLSYEGGYLRQSSRIFARFYHKGFYNLTESEIVNYEVDDFIQLVDPNFSNALKRRFERIGFFAVSAAGARLDEPLLWILHQLGIIDGFYESELR